MIVNPPEGRGRFPGERARILALTRLPPPAITGLTNWSSYEMAKYLKRHEGISVSHNFIHELWQENGLRPHLQGTFKLSKTGTSLRKSSISWVFTCIPRRAR